MKKCVFFDRDGIVNVSPGPGYVQRWEDFKLMPGFGTVLRTTVAKGYAAAIATNQRGVALGLVDSRELERMHRNLRDLLKTQFGVSLIDIYCCPHQTGTCDCRKPHPGLLLRAAAEHDIDLGASWMIGDSDRDIEAGQRAGCRTILVGEGGGAAAPDYRVANMDELNALLERVL